MTLNLSPANALMLATQDTSASAAYVTRPGGPPDNGAFMNGAYTVAVVIYASYIVLMVRRMAAARRVTAARASAARPADRR